MSHRPVCRKCEHEMLPEKNGIWVEDETRSVGSYQVWMADLWKCPGCGIEIVSSFGCGPAYHRSQPDYTEKVDNLKRTKEELVIRCMEG